METFYCENCRKIFGAKGNKKEWKSSVFGKCWKLVAQCPNCGTESREYRPSSFRKPFNQQCDGTCSACSGCR